MPTSRPFGEGLPAAVLKLAEDYDGNTYRAAYTVAFAGVVYVLHVFQKKSKSGIKTPQAVKDRVLQRYHAAEAHYRAHHAPPPRSSRR